MKKSLPSLDTEGITPGKIGRLRQQVREVLKQELAEIDGMVRGMVGGSLRRSAPGIRLII
jgi:hypothetical protein